MEDWRTHVGKHLTACVNKGTLWLSNSTGHISQALGVGAEQAGHVRPGRSDGGGALEGTDATVTRRMMAACYGIPCSTQMWWTQHSGINRDGHIKDKVCGGETEWQQQPRNSAGILKPAQDGSRDSSHIIQGPKENNLEWICRVGRSTAWELETGMMAVCHHGESEEKEEVGSPRFRERRNRVRLTKISWN